jgi:hypothetical protein
MLCYWKTNSSHFLEYSAPISDAEYIRIKNSSFIRLDASKIEEEIDIYL